MTTGRINQVTTLASDDGDVCVARRYLVIGRKPRSNAERLTLARRSMLTEQASVADHYIFSTNDEATGRGVQHGTTARTQRAATTIDDFYLALPEHSLRGRNIQDGRVRIETIRDRNYRSGPTATRQTCPQLKRARLSHISQPGIFY